VVDVTNLDIAIAHWHINAWGGAEYLVTKLAEALDVDTVYTLGQPSPSTQNPYGDVGFEDVTPTLDYHRIRRLQHRAGRLFDYAQWEDVDWRELGDPDVLVTSGATTRSVITPDNTLHVNYCHSPPRWFYDLYHDRKGSLSGFLGRPLIRYLRMRDMAIDPRVDYYFVNSPIIERRLWKYYKRDSKVLYPPIELDEYYNDGDEGFYFHLGRLDKQKGVPTIVEAFADTDHRLVFAGGRGDVADEVLDRIRSTENFDYRGFVSEAEKYELLATCRAVVFNGRNEDFGIVPIEANASGKACLVPDEGFPGLFVEDGVTGYVHDGTPAGIRDVVDRFEREGIASNPRAAVERLGFEQFCTQLRDGIATAYGSLHTSVSIHDYD